MHKIDSYQKQHYLFVPFYNEELRFDASYFIRLIDVCKLTGFQLIFINDGSTDGTTNILRDFASKYGISVIEFQKNMGKSNALRESFLKCLKTNSNVKAIGYVDSDGAFPVETIEEFLFSYLSNVKEYDLYIGSRVKLAGKIIMRNTGRHFIGRFISNLLNFSVLPVSVYDVQSGLKIFSVSENLLTSLENRFLTNWFGEVEMIIRFKGSINIIELPVQSWHEIEKGKLNYRASFSILSEVCTLMRISRKI